MIIHNQAEQQESADQWDGTDIEPAYPSRKVRKEQDSIAHERYIADHREGDRFS